MNKLALGNRNLLDGLTVHSLNGLGEGKYIVLGGVASQVVDNGVETKNFLN